MVDWLGLRREPGLRLAAAAGRGHRSRAGLINRDVGADRLLDLDPFRIDALDRPDAPQASETALDRSILREMPHESAARRALTRLRTAPSPTRFTRLAIPGLMIEIEATAAD